MRNSLDCPVSGATRSQNVCHACILRKKACDKTLPACGFCASRRLLCRYDISVPQSKGRRTYNPGRHFVPLRSPPSSISSQAEVVTGQLPSPQSQQDHMFIDQSSLYVFPRSGEESLNLLAQQFTDLTKLTRDTIIDRYFRAFHKWLPVVSPNSFRREASLYLEGRPPPADFTVLFLAILLILLPTLDPPSRAPRETQELLYMTTKSAFSQVQTSICTSLRLVQAGILLALREYTCIRPATAYVSTMTCAGLARVMGIRVKSERIEIYPQEPSESKAAEMEREKLAWAIAMLERLILCEMDQIDLQPQTEYPGPGYPLPSDLEGIIGLDSKPGSNLQKLNQLTVSSLYDADDGQLGLQIQSVSLLDRLLLVMRLSAKNRETRLAELAELDCEIRSLLQGLIGELEWRQALICVHVALCVRLLFLLHGSIVDVLQNPQSETEHQQRDVSWIGLDMVCRMTLDFAQWHSEETAQIMPFCGFYNLQAARKRMQERNRIVIDEARSRDIDTLLRAEEKDHKTWVF